MVGKLAVAGLAGLMMAQAANAASMMFTYTQVDSGAGLGAGPFGTVTVTESGGSLIFTQTLAAGFRIHDGNANHNAFAFKILGDPAVTVTGLTAGFTAIALGSGSGSYVSSPPFGDYFAGIDCSSACGPGYGGGYTGTLTFTVSSASALTLASLGFNTVGGKNVYFTTDVVNANDKTGNVGATISTAPAVPEPATWAMMIGGFGAIGGAMRYRRRKVAVSFA